MVKAVLPMPDNRVFLHPAFISTLSGKICRAKCQAPITLILFSIADTIVRIGGSRVQMCCSTTDTMLYAEVMLSDQ